MLKKLTIVLGMAVAVAGTTTVSSFVFVPEAQAWGYKNIKKSAKKVGRKAKKGGKAVGRAAKKGGKAVGRTARKGGKAVGRTARKGGKAVGRNGRTFGRSAWKRGKAAGRVARETGKGIRDAGKGFGEMGKCIVKRNCKATIGPLPAGTKGNPRPAVRIHRSSAPVTAHRS